MTSDQLKPFGGYGLADRTFRIKATDLVVSRLWERSSFHSEASGELSTRLIGKAISEKDSVCVIGWEQETREFELIISSDEDAARRWEKAVAIDPPATDGSLPEQQLNARIYERLSNEPPTAALIFLERDREIGLEETWSIECKIPSDVLEKLEAETLAQRSQDISIGIEWVGGLVWDRHTPISFPTTWGLFSVPGRHGPEPLRGYIKSILWDAYESKRL